MRGRHGRPGEAQALPLRPSRYYLPTGSAVNESLALGDTSPLFSGRCDNSATPGGARPAQGGERILQSPHPFFLAPCPPASLPMGAVFGISPLSPLSTATHPPVAEADKAETWPRG